MYLAHYENGLDFGLLKGDRGVGTFGGSEDHTAILLGRRNTLLFCRFCPTEIIRTVPVPEGLQVMVAFSGKRAEKTRDAMAKYNYLSIVAADAVNALNAVHGTDFSFLRDFYGELRPESRADAARADLKGKGDSVAGRAFQFFREVHIVSQAVHYLASGELSQCGELVNKSHELSRDYLGNIADEIDWLHQSANQLGAFGATGFGGGFGGCCHALVPSAMSADFLSSWREAYLSKYSRYGETAQFDSYPACGGSYWSLR
jgi:galactokinase